MELRDYLEGEPRRENQEYIICVGEKLKSFSKEMLKYSMQRKNKIVYFLNISSFRTVQINLFSNEENYENYMKKLEDNKHIRTSINYYIPDSHLKSKYLLKKDMLEITRSLIKLVIAENSKNVTPWFIEGITENMSGEREDLQEEENLLNWIEEKKILEIKNMSDYDKNDLAYFLVRYLFANTPKAKILEMFSDKNVCIEVERTILKNAVTYYKNRLASFIEKPKSNKVEIFNGVSEGQNRNDIKIGMTVKIVLKKDQPTGILTTGKVGKILTHSLKHHRGIKVMLEDGQVGRVQVIVR